MTTESQKGEKIIERAIISAVGHKSIYCIRLQNSLCKLNEKVTVGASIFESRKSMAHNALSLLYQILRMQTEMLSNLMKLICVERECCVE